MRKINKHFCLLRFVFLYFFLFHFHFGYGQLFHSGSPELLSRIDSIKASYENHVEVQNWQKAAIDLENLAKTQLSIRQFDEAFETFKKARLEAKKHGLNEMFLSSSAAVGEMLQMRGKYKESKEIFEEIIELSELKKDRRNYSIKLVKLGQIHTQLGNYDTAKYYLDNGIQIKKEIKDSFGLFLPYNYYSIYYQRLGEWNTALEYQLEAIEIKKTEGDSISLPMLIKVVSDIFMKQGDWIKAEKYAKESLEIAEKYNLRLTISGCYENLAQINLSKNNDQIAAEYLEKAIEIQKKTKNIHLVFNLLELAEIKIRSRQYEPVLAVIDEAYELAVESGDHILSSKAEMVKGNYYNEQNIDSKATFWYRKGLLRADSFNLRLMQMNLNEKLAEIYEKNNESERALFHHKKYTSLKDSIFNQNKQTLVHELETKYQLKEKEGAISQLNAQNELKDLRLAEAQRQRIAFLLALLGLALLAASGFYLFKIKRDSNEKLAEKNEIISTALSEKEILLKEIHHRVKNNLQVVSSILKLQSIHLSDENALAALNEGRNRVQSMALIHQNLYRDDNVTSVNAIEYIEKLAETLFNSYNVEPERIKLNTQIQSIMLDVDTAIPLGLILNELITNALKHAFRNSEKGELTVNLNESPDGLSLIVADNGSGIIPEKAAERKGKSFGMELVELLSEKLEATMSVNSEQGTSVKLLIKNYKLA